MMKNIVQKNPFLRFLYKIRSNLLTYGFKPFPGSKSYWDRLYKFGGTSGSGSLDKLAIFKAETLNQFVNENKVRTIIEFGCGDGNQLTLSEYPNYIGFDVSSNALTRCEKIFSKDTTKTFTLIENYSDERAELSLSLDVIFHLVEDDVFTAYMERLFDSSEKFVIIYSSNTNQQNKLQAAHVKHRKFSDWIENYRDEWELIKYIPNKYPYVPIKIFGVAFRYPFDDHTGSFSDFYIYKIKH